MNRWLIAIACMIVVGGCGFTIPGVPIDGAADGAPPDLTQPDGTAPVPCANPILDEPFTDPVPCAPWADGFMTNGTLTQGNGMLSVSLVTGSASAVGCTAKTSRPLAAGGAIVELPQVVSGGGTYTQLQVLKAESVSLGVNGTQFRYANNSGSSVYRAAPYDAVAMRWWRLRPDPGGAAIIAEYSADGTTWVLFHTQATVLENMKVMVIVGSNGGTSNGTSQFTRLVTCP